MKQAIHVDRGEWGKLFDELDQNGDGVLTHQEFWSFEILRNTNHIIDALKKFDVSIQVGNLVF